MYNPGYQKNANKCFPVSVNLFLQHYGLLCSIDLICPYLIAFVNFNFSLPSFINDNPLFLIDQSLIFLAVISYGAQRSPQPLICLPVSPKLHNTTTINCLSPSWFGSKPQNLIPIK